MKKELYNFIGQVRDQLKKSAGDPLVINIVQECRRFKGSHLPNWYMLYLKGVCKTLGKTDLDDYTLPKEYQMDGNSLKLYFAITHDEIVSMLGQHSRVGYYNRYGVEDELFVVSSYKDFCKRSGTNSGIAVLFKDFVYFPEKVKSDEIQTENNKLPIDNVNQ